MDNKFFKMRSGELKDLPEPPKRDPRTLYVCKDGGIYLGEDLVADITPNIPAIGIYCATSISGDSLNVQEIVTYGSGGTWGDAEAYNGDMFFIINPNNIVGEFKYITFLDYMIDASDFKSEECGDTYSIKDKQGLSLIAYNNKLYPSNTL